MTTYGTFDIDSVPAPSDIELEAADLRIAIENLCRRCAADSGDKRTTPEYAAFVVALAGAARPEPNRVEQR